jgi:hypothetical protein
MDGITIRQRFDALESQRKTLDDTFQSIEKYVVPYRGEFFKPLSSMLEVEWRRRFIFDSTAPVACDTLASKLHVGITNPFIRWFNLAFRDKTLKGNHEAQIWLEEVRDIIWETLKESDFDTEIAEAYLDLCSFGTSVIFEEELNETTWEGLAFTTIPVRDAYFEMGADDNVLRVYRRLQYTILQLKDKFPDYDFSHLAKVKEGDEGTNVDEKFDVVFCVYNRPDVDKDTTSKRAPSARPYGYKYILHRDSEELEEGGYYNMPAFVVRWKKVSGSVWGHSPAFVCLSDILQLNEVVQSTSEARIKEVDPPMKATERGVISDLDISDGGLTIVTEMDELDRLLPPNPMAFSDVEIERLQNAIKENYFTNKLELKVSPAMTATEVIARMQMIMEMFASSFGRLQSDLLDKLITITFQILGRNGRLPPLPESMGLPQLDIKYIGPIPRAMMNERAQSLFQWISQIANLDALAPGLNMLDIVDIDAVARALGFDYGVSAEMMRSKEAVTALREKRANQQEEARQFEMMQQAGKTMKDMGISGEEEQTLQ